MVRLIILPKTLREPFGSARVSTTCHHGLFSSFCGGRLPRSGGLAGWSSAILRLASGIDPSNLTPYHPTPPHVLCFPSHNRSLSLSTSVTKTFSLSPFSTHVQEPISHIRPHLAFVKLLDKEPISVSPFSYPRAGINRLMKICSPFGELIASIHLLTMIPIQSAPPFLNHSLNLEFFNYRNHRHTGKSCWNVLVASALGGLILINRKLLSLCRTESSLNLHQNVLTKVKFSML